MTEGSNAGRPEDEASTPEDASELPPAQSPAGAIVEQVVTLVIAISIALVIRQCLIEPFRIPSGSMFPTLLVGDHLFVNKLAYGPRIPFTDIRLPGWREPERGDVVVFEVARPLNNRGGRDIKPVDQVPDDTPSEDFVKRLIGLPGDTIEWRRGQLLVNGVSVEMEPVEAGFVGDDGQRYEMAWEELEDCRHAILDGPRPTRDPRFDRGIYVVEEGRYFMMGDNRDNSNDSRGWGTVRMEELKGPAFILYWSWDVNGNMLSFFNPVNWWNAEKRWDRLFQRVQCEPARGATTAGPLDPGESARRG